MRPTRSHRDTHGQLIPIVALMIVLLLGLVAMVIDGGRGYLDRRALQSTADTAALSGAGQLEVTGRSRFDFSYARAAAINEAISNLPGTSLPSTYYAFSSAGSGTPGTCGATTPLQCDISGVSLGSSYTMDVQATLTTVTATLHHKMPLTFGVSAGFGPSITPTASATAENGGLGFALILFRNNCDGGNDCGNLVASGSGVTLQIQGLAGATGDAMTNEGICPAPGVVDFGNTGDQYAFLPTWSKFPGSCGSVGSNVTNMSGSPSSLIQEPQIADPNYPEPTVGTECSSAWSTNTCGSEVSISGTVCLPTGDYSSITVTKGSTLILRPGGAYRIDDSSGKDKGFSVANGATVTPITSGNVSNCHGYSSTGVPADTGVAIDMVPVNAGGTTTGAGNQLSVTSGANFKITSSKMNRNVSIYVEKGASGPCTWAAGQGCGSSVVVFQAGAVYNVTGVVYGYSDNMTFGGGSGGTGLGQVFAWTMKINGNGTVSEAYDPALRPTLQGLIN
jgi:Putative Flp pilus-assembly TadE/G-like